MSVKDSILIGVGTIDRLDLLEKCLDSLIVQQIPRDVSVEIAVVNNGAGNIPDQLVKKISAKSKIKINYMHEPVRGYANMRNQVVDFARNSDFSYVAFIDDDEYAEKNWIKSFYEVISNANVHAVKGPVENIFVGEETPYMQLGRDKHINEGKELGKNVATNNVIFSSILYKDWGLRFDERFNKVGGEDIDFFYRSSIKGGKHIWTNKAVVSEYLPEYRRGFKFGVVRSFRCSYANVVMCLVNKSFSRLFLSMLPRSVIKIVIGLLEAIISSLLFLLSVKKAKKKFYKACKKIAWGCGVLQASLFFTKYL